MRSYYLMSRLIVLFLCLPLFTSGQSKLLIGYWQNWNDASCPYIQLDQIDMRYNVIEVSFAVPTSPSNMNIIFTPDGITQSQLISKIQAMQCYGKKVLISIGGANASIDLSTAQNKTAFINSIISIVNTYGFDGIDLDIENGNSILALGGTITNPTNVAVINLIDAVKQIMSGYFTTHGKKMMLTMAPETAYVHGGQSAFGGIWGGYLPIIHALRDSIDILQVQLYNSGSMYGLDGNIYTQGTIDFIIAMAEAVIRGFNTSGGFFAGLPARKIAVGLPACTSAAGGGYMTPSSLISALIYLKGTGPKPGTYTLIQAGGYPDLGGLMTWSVNWDAVSTCSSTYEFATTFEQIFGATLVTNTNDSGPGSLRQVLQSASSNAIISFVPSIFNDTIRISSGPIIIDKQVNIVQKGCSVINIKATGNGTGPIFNLNSESSSLVLDYVQLFTNNNTGQGRAITSMGAMNLRNVNIYEKAQVLSSGSTIVNQTGATVTISGLTKIIKQ